MIKGISIGVGGLLGLALAWPGAACAADDQPAGLALRYTTEILSDVSGGASHGTGWLGRLDLGDDSGEDFLGIPGAHGHADIFLLHGPNFSDRFSGDVQTASNIDAPSALRPFEIWIEAPIAPHLRAKAGLIDLNDEFDQQSVGDPFLNSSFGIGPDFSQSGLNGPSIYPVTSLGLVLALEKDGRNASIGISDAEPGYPDHPGRFLPGPIGRDGALLVGEIGLPVGKAGHFQIGGWRYTDRFERLDGRGHDTGAGAYALIQYLLTGSEDGVALRVWLRAGIAADRVDRIGAYLGGGVTYGGKTWLAGIAIAHARFGDRARALNPGLRKAETSFEFTISRRFARWIAVQPDVQYIRHPSLATTQPDAVVIGLRFHFDLPGG